MYALDSSCPLPDYCTYIFYTVYKGMFYTIFVVAVSVFAGRNIISTVFVRLLNKIQLSSMSPLLTMCVHKNDHIQQFIIREFTSIDTYLTSKI